MWGLYYNFLGHEYLFGVNENKTIVEQKKKDLEVLSELATDFNNWSELPHNYDKYDKYDYNEKYQELHIKEVPII